jgi:hypothetical protein
MNVELGEVRMEVHEIAHGETHDCEPGPVEEKRIQPRQLETVKTSSFLRDESGVASRRL